MSKMSAYVARYGPDAGPKLLHAAQSRSAYIGANARRRLAIAELTGRPYRPRQAPAPLDRSTPLLPVVAGDPPVE